MKRLALSVICGFVIPLLYTVVVVRLTPYISAPAVKQLVGFPVRWPLFVYYRLLYLPFPVLLMYISACNVLFYGLLSYSVMWMLSKRKSVEYPLPPPPTGFEI